MLVCFIYPTAFKVVMVIFYARIGLEIRLHSLNFDAARSKRSPGPNQKSFSCPTLAGVLNLVEVGRT